MAITPEHGGRKHVDETPAPFGSHERMNAHPADQVATRDLPPLALRAAFNPRSVNLEARTVDVIWSTGAKVLRGFFDRFWEELSMDPKHVRLARLDNSGGLLNSHNTYDLASRIGTIETGTVKIAKGGEGLATVRFSKRADVEPIFLDVKDGIIRDVSVGYRVYKFEKVEDVTEKIPTYRAIDWEPYEISLVAVGADPGAGVRSETPATLESCQFILPGSARGLSDADRNRFLRLARASRF